MQQGYLIFEGIECVYSKLDDCLIVTPKNESDISGMLQNCNKTKFILEYQHQIYKKSVAYIEKIVPRLDHSFRFISKYTMTLIGDYEINGFVLTGDDIDVFFSPATYFFLKKRDKEYITEELLYGKVEADKFIFTYCSQKISVSLYYGGILQNGIRSDLKLHPQLKVELGKTKDFNFIYDVYKLIVKFLQLVRYQKNLNLETVDIFGTTEKNSYSNLGKMYSKPYLTKNYSKKSDSEYIIFKPFISQILQLVSNDKDFSIRHLPLEENDSHNYDVLRYLSVFSAFEYECNKNAEEYLLQSDELLKNIKNGLLHEIDLLKKKASNDNEIMFLENARGRISQLGTQFGQEMKIINAYNKVENIIKESMVYLLPEGFKIKVIAAKLTKLRAKIAHDNLYRELMDEELRNIRFMEVLGYILFLKRAGIHDDGIELIVGAVFHCNFKYMEYDEKN